MPIIGLRTKYLNIFYIKEVFFLLSLKSPLKPSYEQYLRHTPLSDSLLIRVFYIIKLSWHTPVIPHVGLVEAGGTGGQD